MIHKKNKQRLKEITHPKENLQEIKEKSRYNSVQPSKEE